MSTEILTKELEDFNNTLVDGQRMPPIEMDEYLKIKKEYEDSVTETKNLIKRMKIGTVSHKTGKGAIKAFFKKAHALYNDCFDEAFYFCTKQEAKSWTANTNQGAVQTDSGTFDLIRMSEGFGEFGSAYDELCKEWDLICELFEVEYYGQCVYTFNLKR